MSLCNNCGKYGHLFQQCKSPINSYGIIAFTTTTPSQPQFLMIRRKDSFGYIDFIRGKYSPFNVPQLQKIVNEMSIDEKNGLIDAATSTTATLEQSFTILWQQLWGHHGGSSVGGASSSLKWSRATGTMRKSEEESTSFRKFETIINGVYFNGAKVTLQTLIQSSITLWNETEWEFPKGRRNTPKEKEIDCALREFEEETGIPKTSLQIIENLAPFEETFIGTNYKAYKHKYFLAYIAPTAITLHTFQQNEVSKIECVTLEQAMKYIRPYNIEKKTMLQHVYNTVTQFTIA